MRTPEMSCLPAKTASHLFDQMPAPVCFVDFEPSLWKLYSQGSAR